MVSSAENRTYRFASFTLDLDRGALLAAGGNEMPLRPKSFALLWLLIENAGRLLSREAILRELWPDIYVTEDNVTQCIHEIRGALGAEANQLLRTIPRRGYLFTHDVVAAGGVDPPRDPAGGKSGRNPPIPAALPTDEPLAGENGRTALPGGGNPKLPRLSVIAAPLKNLGVPAEHEYLVDAIPDDIATDLSKHTRILTVVAWPESAGAAVGVREIGRSAGVSYVLQGSIRGTADRLAVNVQIIDVETGVHLWSESFDIHPAGATDTRNEITSRVALMLVQRLIEHNSRRIGTLSPDDWTHDDFLYRGYDLLYRPMTAQNSPDPRLQEALRCFERALTLRPDSVVAKIGMAYVLVGMVAAGEKPRNEPDDARVEQLVADIVRTAGENPFAHIIMGILRLTQGRLDDALIELRLAMDLEPNQPATLTHLAMTLVRLGEPDVAAPLLEKSLRLSPHDNIAALSHCFLGLCRLVLGDTAASVTSLRTARAMNPRIFWVHWWLASALGLKGELDEANDALKQALVMNPDIGRTIPSIRLALPKYSALFEKTVYPGLLRAGLPDVLADCNNLVARQIGKPDAADKP